MDFCSERGGIGTGRDLSTVRLINKYDIDYLLLSTKSMEEYDISSLFYAEEDCFYVVYDRDVLIYEFLGCEVE